MCQRGILSSSNEMWSPFMIYLPSDSNHRNQRAFWTVPAFRPSDRWRCSGTWGAWHRSWPEEESPFASSSSVSPTVQSVTTKIDIIVQSGENQSDGTSLWLTMIEKIQTSSHTTVNIKVNKKSKPFIQTLGRHVCDVRPDRANIQSLHCWLQVGLQSMTNTFPF